MATTENKKKRNNKYEDSKVVFRKETVADYKGTPQVDSVLTVTRFTLVTLDDSGNETGRYPITEIKSEKRTYDKNLNDGKGGVYMKERTVSLASDRFADADFLKALHG